MLDNHKYTYPRERLFTNELACSVLSEYKTNCKDRKIEHYYINFVTMLQGVCLLNNHVISFINEIFLAERKRHL